MTGVSPRGRGVVLGTAGHIDHGKTTLVRALTGMDCDRLPEEKRRGITIDLGFAHFVRDGVPYAIVDVPGHERFVRTMVAGASGIDVVLLVVAADEGVMPQTREHLDVCRLLGVSRGIVVVTKADLVDDDLLAVAMEDVRDAVAGTFLDGAPILPLDALHPEEDAIERVKDAMASVARGLRARDDGGPFRLPLDRVFTLRGFGTVVTGTCLSGRVQEGDAVVVLPSGVEARVRSLEVHGRPVSSAAAGMRTALNLQGVERAEVSRGEVVSHPGRLAVGRRFDCKLRLLEHGTPIRHRARGILHAGTAAVQATVLLLEADALEPGAEALAQIQCDRPIVVLPGDRFILRGFGNVGDHGRTLGGGEVLGVLAPRRRRKDAAVVAALRNLSGPHGPDLRDAILRAVEDAGVTGMVLSDLPARLPWSARQVESAVADLLAEGLLRAAGEGAAARLLHVRNAERLALALASVLDAFHATHPREAGLGKEEARSRLRLPCDEVFPAVVALAVEEGKLVVEADRLRRPGFVVPHDSALDRLKERLVEEMARSGVEVRSVADLASAVRTPEEEVLLALRELVRGGEVVCLKGGMYVHRPSLRDLARRLVEELERRGGKGISMQEFKDLVGASRKTAVPLAEHFDACKLTLRVGETRFLRRRDAPV